MAGILRLIGKGMAGAGAMQTAGQNIGQSLGMLAGGSAPGTSGTANPGDGLNPLAQRGHQLMDTRGGLAGMADLLRATAPDPFRHVQPPIAAPARRLMMRSGGTPDPQAAALLKTLYE